MEKITISDDIVLLCSKAPSFPDRIREAFADVEQKIGSGVTDRTFYGLSRPESGIIVYRAAVEALASGEGAKYQLEEKVLRKGTYLAETIGGWKKDVQRIGQTFQKMIAEPGLDPEAYCVEVYQGEQEVTCMVRLKDAQ